MKSDEQNQIGKQCILNIVQLAVVLKTVAGKDLSEGQEENNKGPRTEPCGTPGSRGTVGNV